MVKNDAAAKPMPQIDNRAVTTNLVVGTLLPWRLQRPLNKQHARNIARDFDPDKLDYLRVSRRDAAELLTLPRWREFAQLHRLAQLPRDATVDLLLDGQHRHHALVEIMGWGDQNVPVLLYTGLTDEQENAIFAAQAPDARRALSGIHTFRVEFDNGDEFARRIVTTVHHFGCHMAWTGDKQDGAIRSVGALENVARKQGFYALGEVLRVLRDGPGPDYRAFNNDAIEGAAAFLARYAQHEAFDRAHLTKRLHAAGVDGIRREQATVQAATRCHSYVAYGRAMLHIYNHLKRSGRLPEWQDAVNATNAEIRANQAANSNESKRKIAQFPRKAS